MEFVGVVGIFAVFFLGLVLAIQGVIGKEIASEGRAFATPRDPEHPGMAHPRERHRGRLILIGVGLMAVAIVLGLILL
jgi:hypothetical protein